MARVSHFYGMEYPAVLAMPLRAFWAFNRNVDRLRAENEYRTLSLMCAAQGPEGAEALGKKLATEMGTPVVVVKPFDPLAFEKALEMSKQKLPVG